MVGLLMHYKIHGIEIRSENAAKTISEGAKALITWLASCDYVENALDYGCGKLRYTAHVAKRCSSLAIVDSKIQIERTQRIDGSSTTVRKYAQTHWPNCKIYYLEQFWDGIPDSYDFVLCANVLSAIPSAKIRARSLRAIYASLSRNGELLVVNQHTNSYFGKVKLKPNVFGYLDGWVVQSRNGGAYYGILNRVAVVRLLRKYEFTISDAWIKGQSNFVLASKR